jgi:uncharacterized surface protein with fasciclin (FAS1) repeats
LDGPILPKNDKFLQLTARKVLQGMNATRFIQLFDEHELGSYLDNDQSDVMTILAPSNDALNEDSFVSKSKTREWLKYHIVHGRYEPSDLIDGQLLETESHYDLGNDYYQRLDVHLSDQDSSNPLAKQSIQFGKSGVLSDPGN